MKVIIFDPRQEQVMLRKCMDYLRKQISGSSESSYFVPANSEHEMIVRELAYERLLILEDKSGLQTNKKKLENFGCQVTSTSSLEEFKTELEKNDFDLVMVCRDLDSEECMRVLPNLKRIAEYDGCAVVAVVPSVQAHRRLELLRFGFQDVLVEPLQPQEISRVIDRWGTQSPLFQPQQFFLVSQLKGEDEAIRIFQSFADSLVLYRSEASLYKNESQRASMQELRKRLVVTLRSLDMHTVPLPAFESCEKKHEDVSQFLKTSYRIERQIRRFLKEIGVVAL